MKLMICCGKKIFHVVFKRWEDVKVVLTMSSTVITSDKWGWLCQKRFLRSMEIMYVQRSRDINASTSETRSMYICCNRFPVVTAKFLLTTDTVSGYCGMKVCWFAGLPGWMSETQTDYSSLFTSRETTANGVVSITLRLEYATLRSSNPKPEPKPTGSTMSASSNEYLNRNLEVSRFIDQYSPLKGSGDEFLSSKSDAHQSFHRV